MGATFLAAAVKRSIFGDIDFITSSHDGWTVYLRDPDDLPACEVCMWAGLPVRYAVLPGGNA